MSAFGLEPVEVPDFAQALEAWRAWRVVAANGGYRLGSVVKPTLWPPGEPLVAECLSSSAFAIWFRRRSKPHGAPEERCQCGIYAAELPVVQQYLADPPAGGAVARVLGKVSLWGTVVECERGLRASRAYPARLYVPVDCSTRLEHRWDDLLAGLEVYGVPVERLPARCSDAVAALGPDGASR